MANHTSTKGESVTLPVDSKAMSKWQPGVFVGKLINGLSMLKPGDTLTRKGGKNKGKSYINHALVIAPTPIPDLVKSGMSQAEAEKLNTEAMADGKAVAMGRITAASTRDAFVLRRHMENPETGIVQTTLKYTNADAKLAAVAAEYGITVEELKSRLPAKGVTLKV